MTSKQRRRKNNRKEQSLKDKERILHADVTYGEPLREYNSFLDHLKSHGYARNEFTRIPLNLIGKKKTLRLLHQNLAAAIIASMITGREMSLFGSCLHRNETSPKLEQGYDSEQLHERYQRTHGPQQDTNNNYVDPENDETTGVFYFIHRILKRTQLSCTTLVLALIYIDRFKARLSRSLKKRTRLDQGPDHDGHALSNSSSSPSSFWTRRSHRNKESVSSTESRPSSPSVCSSSNTSPSSSISTTTVSSSTRAGVRSNTSSPSQQQGRIQDKPWSSISLILVAFICADKYLFDATFTNAEWAEFTKGQYTTKEINDLERRFLNQLDYKLYVSEQDFDGFLAYLEVVLTLKRVWGRGLMAAFTYTDVRILTQRLLPHYADRLQFRTLQVDMVAVLWQVMAAISRVYLTIVGAVIFAAASYTAMVELSALGGKGALILAAPKCLPSIPGSEYLPSLPIVASSAGEEQLALPTKRTRMEDSGDGIYPAGDPSSVTSSISWMPASPTLVHVQFVECH
ncbi:hypothetical protein BGZ83_001528 [Gryganskiella cystojenkinii]|nr:hypothetical protein BGZ83_001528 [Gryganskiella cystojenkinii]